MSLPAGSRLGPYEIVEPLGAGGMGEVYRARDERLGRDVAIKVLPPAFAADAERRARFEREAQTVAALSHPHVVSLFDTGIHDDQIFVVMELLEGETLRERLTTGGALPARKAIEYAVQIARGLAAAHEKGLVHRDLKPENVFLLTDGHVKVLDFGLARTSGGSGSGSGATETVAALTDPGLVMGTIGYMAPEQVRGRAVDGRADLFAFGAVLYEMLTGSRAFHRDTPADTMTAILKEEPPELSAVRGDLPPALDCIVRHCLEKNPAERFQSTRDVAFALESLSGSAPTTIQTAPISADETRSGARVTVRELIAWTLALAGVAATAITIGRWPAPQAAPAVARFSVPIEASAAALGAQISISPDGQWIVIAISLGAERRLLLRRLDSTDVRVLAGTENAQSPFWSPDSQSIGFVASGVVKRFDLTTSTVRQIASLEVPAFGLPAWGRGGTILVPTVRQPLQRIHENGGTPAPAGVIDESTTEVQQARPVFLPDGQRYFYQSVRGAGGTTAIVLASLDSGQRTSLAVPETRIIWASDNRVVFRRGEGLYTQGVTLDPLALIGEPTLLTTDAEGGGAGGVNTARESVSNTGVIVFAERAMREQRLHWYGRDGRVQGSVGDGGLFTTFDLSYDGRQVVVSIRDGSAAHLWLLDAERGTRTRMTIGSFVDVDPRWSADDTSVIFGSTRDSVRSPHRVKPAADTPALLWKFDGRLFALDDWSPDGRWLIFHEATAPVLQARELDATGAPKGDPIIVARALAGIIDQAHMSPDGRWIAFNATESGRPEVFVTPFPPTGERFPVSRGGGAQPTWRGDGSELYYLTLDGALNAVKVSTSGTKFMTSEPVEIARPRLAGVNSSVEQYRPHPSGAKFLFLETVGDNRNLTFGVVLNWPSLIR